MDRSCVNSKYDSLTRTLRDTRPVKLNLRRTTPWAREEGLAACISFPIILGKKKKESTVELWIQHHPNTDSANMQPDILIR